MPRDPQNIDRGVPCTSEAGCSPVLEDDIEHYRQEGAIDMTHLGSYPSVPPKYSPELSGLPEARLHDVELKYRMVQ